MACSFYKCGMTGVLALGAVAAVALSAGMANSQNGQNQDGNQEVKQDRFTLDTILTRDLTYATEGSERYDAAWEKIKSQLGKPAAAFHVGEWQSLNSEMKGGTLESMRGEIVVIDFWGTWCPPCRAAMPKNSEMAEKYAEKQVRVIGICNTNKSDVMMETAEKHDGRFAMAADVDDKTKEAYGVQWWPYYVIVDREGIVRAAGVKSDKITEVVDRLLVLQPPKDKEETETAPRRRSR